MWGLWLGLLTALGVVKRYIDRCGGCDHIHRQVTMSLDRWLYLVVTRSFLRFAMKQEVMQYGVIPYIFYFFLYTGHFKLSSANKHHYKTSGDKVISHGHNYDTAQYIPTNAVLFPPLMLYQFSTYYQPWYFLELFKLGFQLLHLLIFMAVCTIHTI